MSLEPLRAGRALVFLLASFSLLLLANAGQQRTARLLAVAAGLTLAGCGAGFLLWRHDLFSSDLEHWPGAANAGLLFAGISIATISSRRASVFHVGHVLALGTAAIGCFSTLIRLYGVVATTPLSSWQGAAAITNVELLLTGIATVCLRPDRGVGSLLCGNALGNRVARPLFAASLLLPVLVEQIAFAARSAGLRENEATALHSVLVAATLGTVTLLGSAWLVRAEHVLRESDERYRDLVENSGDLICTHDLDGRLLSVNPTASRMLGIAPARLLQMKIQDLLDPGHRPAFHDYIETMVSQKLASGVMRIVDASGAVRIWEYENTLHEREGAPPIVRGLARDITERRMAESALRKSEARYRMLFEDAPHPALVFDEQSLRMVAVNAAAVRQFRHTAQQLLTMTILDPAFTADVERVSAALAERIPVRQRSSIRFRRNDGSEFLADVVSSAIEYEGRAARLVQLTDVTEREQVRRDLFEARQFSEEVISGAGQGIVAMDRDLRIIVWNRFMEELTGVEASRAIGSRPGSLLSALLHGTGTEEALRDVLRVGKSRTLVLGGLRDEPRSLLMVGVPHRNQADEIVGIIAIITDITAQKETEEALRRSEELYRSVLDCSPNHVYSFDRGGRLLTANRALCTAMRLDVNDVIGRTGTEIGFDPDGVRDWTKAGQRVIRTGERAAFRSSVTMPDSELHTYDVFMGPVRDSEGSVSGVGCIAIDVTESLRATATLTRLSQAVEQAAEVILMTDRDGTITYANPAFQSVYGYSREETIGKTPRLIKSGVYSQADYEQLWQSILAGKTVREEVINKSKDGRLVTVDRSVSPVYGGNGEIIGFLSVQADVTDRKKVEREQELLRSRMLEVGKMQAIGTLAGGIAHDFNNILAIVLTFCTIAEKTRLEPDRFGGAIETIRQAVRRGADLARQVLTFARVSEPSADAVDLNLLVREVQSMVRETFPKTVTVRAQLAASLPVVMIDASHMHQALLNLCVNARDAMPGGGTLTVTTETVQGSRVRAAFPDAPDVSFVMLRVRDTGLGMTKEVMDRIFEPFYTTKTDGRGTGLGLSVTYGVIQAAGGFIGVQSEPGRGSVFEIFLPLPETTAAVETTILPVCQGGGAETILLVEDEPAIKAAVTEALEENGYSVLCASDGVEGLSLFESHQERVQLVVSDDGLPKMAGRDLFHQLRSRKPDLPIVLASGFLEHRVMDDLYRSGLDHFLQKPYEIRDLLKAVRSILDGRDGR